MSIEKLWNDKTYQVVRIDLSETKEFSTADEFKQKFYDKLIIKFSVAVSHNKNLTFCYRSQLYIVETEAQKVVKRHENCCNLRGRFIYVNNTLSRNTITRLEGIINICFKDVATKYLNNYLVYHNVAKENEIEKGSILFGFVRKTLCEGKTFEIAKRQAIHV